MSEDNVTLRIAEEGEKPKADFDGYEYVRTMTDENGRIHHIYRSTTALVLDQPKKEIVTSWVDETDKELKPSENGEKPKSVIEGYEFIRTDKDKDGNVKHVYRKLEKLVEKPKMTKFVDLSGKDIIDPVDGEVDKKDISGWIFVKTDKDTNGNTVHTYKRVVTMFVDQDGKDIINPVDGEVDKKDIFGWEFVKTDKDKDGNTVHVYKKLEKQVEKPVEKETPKATKQLPKAEPQPTHIERQETPQVEKRVEKQPVHQTPKELPKTGDTENLGLLGGILASLGFVGSRRKKKNN